MILVLYIVLPMNLSWQFLNNIQVEFLHCSSVACAALCGSLLLTYCSTQKIYFDREHALRNFRAKQSLKTIKQQNKLLLFWVLHWRSTMILWLHWNFQIIPVSWIILILEQIKSWQWLSFKASWKTPLLYPLLIKYVLSHCSVLIIFLRLHL